MNESDKQAAQGKDIFSPPHPRHFGIPEEHWERAKNYAEYLAQNRQAQPVQPAGAQGEPVVWRYCVAVTHRHGKGYVNRIKTSKLVCTIREAEVIQKEWESWARTGVLTVEIFPVYTAPPAAAINEQLLEALKHAQKVLNHNNLALDCVPVNDAIRAAEAEKAKGGV